MKSRGSDEFDFVLIAWIFSLGFCYDIFGLFSTDRAKSDSNCINLSNSRVLDKAPAFTSFRVSLQLQPQTKLCLKKSFIADISG